MTSRPLPARPLWGRLPVMAQDLLLGLFVATMQVQGTLAKPADAGARPLHDLGRVGYLLLVLPALALTSRRRWPVGVFVAAGLASLVYYGLGFTDGPGSIALFVAAYSVTAYGDGHRSLRVAGAGVATLAVCWLIAGADVEPPAAIGWVFFRIAATILAATLGESVRSRQALATQAQERARHAERTREDEARARVDAERLRIAHEVHDTVAHAVAIINVQAGVTAYMLDRRPDRAREALETIERTSAQALHEMRAVLGVLRDTGDDRVPQPGLNQVDDLAATARLAGLDVTVEAAGPVTLVPSAVDHTAYRIIQESITNVIRHVGPTHVTVAFDVGAEALEVRVTDAGGADPSAPPSAGAGHGIVGMRERCGLLGGELIAGPRTGGGFEVTARLPLVGSAGGYR